MQKRKQGSVRLAMSPEDIEELISMHYYNMKRKNANESKFIRNIFFKLLNTKEFKQMH